MARQLVDIAELRNRHRKSRASLNAEQLRVSADALVRNIAQLEEFTSARHVASYIAIRGEMDTRPLMTRFAEKTYYLPVLREQRMHFAPWRAGSPLVEKEFGLLEPDCSERDWLDPAELDVVLVPLVVFDQHCNRIGQGGGFYDRTFEFLCQRSGLAKPILLGVAHESQREPLLKAQPWDVPLDLVATDNSVYRKY